MSIIFEGVGLEFVNLWLRGRDSMHMVFFLLYFFCSAFGGSMDLGWGWKNWGNTTLLLLFVFFQKKKSQLTDWLDLVWSGLALCVHFPAWVLFLSLLHSGSGFFFVPVLLSEDTHMMDRLDK